MMGYGVKEQGLEKHKRLTKLGSDLPQSPRHAGECSTLLPQIMHKVLEMLVLGSFCEI
jgi:hypothetical protein